MVAPAGTRVVASTGARPVRDASVDLVRLLGVVAVVAGHTWPDGAVRDATFPWHVPVFFVLTGYLWRSRPLAHEALMRAATLLRPYTLWLVVGAAAAMGLSAAGLVDPIEPSALLWGGAQLGGPLTAFWFVTCLFGACVLYGAADRVGPLGRLLAVGLAVGTVVAGAPWMATLPLALGVAVPALLFVEAGRLLRRGAALAGHPMALPLAALVLSGFGVAVVAGTVPEVDLKTGTFGGLAGVAVGIAVSAALLVLARPVAAVLGPRARLAASTAATALVPVVLLHPVVLTLPAWGGDGQRFVAAVLAPIALALLLGRTRLAGWALGRSSPAGTTARSARVTAGRGPARRRAPR